MNSYSPEEYQSDGGFSIVGLPLLIVVLLATALALGWLANFIGQWFYLILLFPLGIGLGLIFTGMFIGRVTKMRNIGIAALLGLMSGVVALLSMHWFDFDRFVSTRDAALAQANPQQRLLLEAEAKDELQVNSFSAFMNYQAKQGVSIGRHGGGFNLGFWGTWIYWSVELIGVAIFATAGMCVGAMAPFCTFCESWKVESPLGALEGEDEKVVEALKKGEIGQLAEYHPARDGGSLLLTTAVCANCREESTIAVKLEKVTTNEKGEQQKSELVQLTYPGTALSEFEALFAKGDAAKERTRTDK